MHQRCPYSDYQAWLFDVHAPAVCCQWAKHKWWDCSAADATVPVLVTPLLHCAVAAAAHAAWFLLQSGWLARKSACRVKQKPRHTCKRSGTAASCLKLKQSGCYVELAVATAGEFVPICRHCPCRCSDNLLFANWHLCQCTRAFRVLARMWVNRGTT